MTRERLISVLKSMPDDARIVLATGTADAPTYHWLRDAAVAPVPMGDDPCIVLAAYGGKEVWS